MLHFIVNPNARSGQGLLIWNKIETELKKRKVEYKTYFTLYQRHATSIVKELTVDPEPKTLVALGGDGTINEVINGIVHPEHITLGYIPIGSGNDFARGMHLPFEISKALDRIINPKIFTQIDFGIVKYKQKERRFVVSSGMGYDAAICHALCISKAKTFFNKLKLGKIAYVFLAFRQLYLCEPQTFTIKMDDKEEMKFEKALFVTAMNLPYEGGGCMFCPKAKQDDGLLDMIVVNDISKWKVFLVLPTVFSGNHTHFKGINLYRFKKATIKSTGSMPLHCEGEPIVPQKEIEFSLAPQKIRFIVG